MERKKKSKGRMRTKKTEDEYEQKKGKIEE